MRSRLRLAPLLCPLSYPAALLVRPRRSSLPTLNEHSVDVVIEGNTMRVRNRMYNIGNLVGTTVDEYEIGFTGSTWEAIWSKKWQVFAILVVSAIATDLWWVQLLAWAGLIATVVQIVKLKRDRATGYILKLETAGKVTGVITSRDPEAINNLALEVAKAINNPPTTAQEYIIYGDLVQQTGNNNVATQVR